MPIVVTSVQETGEGKYEVQVTLDEGTIKPLLEFALNFLSAQGLIAILTAEQQEEMRDFLDDLDVTEMFNA